MKIPKKIRVGGKTYGVVSGHKFKETDRLKGLTDHNQQRIWLTDVDSSGQKYSAEAVEETFLHELIHCVDKIYNHNEGMSEDQVCGLSQGLFQVMKDLKWI